MTGMYDVDAFEPTFAPFRTHSRILLVEDDAEMRSLLTEALRDEGYAVDAAENATQAAMAIVAERDTIDAYDLVLSDVRMPGITGIELTAFVRRLLGPPVVLVSGFATPELIREGRDAGAITVLAKPLDLGRLIALVRKLVPPDAW